MVIQTVLLLFITLFGGALQSVAALSGLVFAYNSAPLSVIGEFCSVGSWLIGSDLLFIVGGSIVFWFGVKTTVGIVLFIWRLLPFT